MKNRSFQDFLNTIDTDKLDYDFAANLSKNFKNVSGSLTNEQHAAIAYTCLATIKAYLGAYHYWLQSHSE